MTQSSKSILDSLGGLAIFKLSLGSKELFHSNFLEFLWDFDEACFLNMINTLLDKPLPIRPDIQYELGREKENFDICIFHKEGNCIIYDLILENKVKSIPYKEQLEKYEERIAKKNSQKKKAESKSDPRYLLLSLAQVFPEKKSISATWKVVHYDNLKTAIEQQTWPSSKPGYSYIGEYCEFIGKLHELGVAILDNLSNEILFDNADVAEFKTRRLHDLYIKLRCTSFMLELKSLLEKKCVPVEILAASQVRKRNNKHNNKPGVYLNVNVFNSVGQIGALVWTGKKKDDIYEVIVQGGQYRHGINQNTTAQKRPKVNGMKSKKERMILNNMWTRLSSTDPSKTFLTTIWPGTVHYPQQPDAKKGKTGPYDDYDNGYIYRYIAYDWIVSVLLDNMVKDIQDIANKRGII